MNNGPRTSRRGAAYLVALLAGSIVTVTGLAALSITTSRARTTSMADHATRARGLADSGLEHALCAIAVHIDNGGTRHDIFGAAEPSVDFDGGTFGWTMRDMDGTAVDNSDQPIVIRAKSQHGPARYGLRAILAPSGVPYDVLDTGMYAGGGIQLATTATLASDRVVGAADSVTATSSVVTAPVESAGTVSGMTFSDTTTSDAPARHMPDPSLIDYYVALGERINMTSLPFSSGSRKLENILLSASNNPFGAPNELGIYVIDCGGARLHIHNIRVVGTLVLLNATADLLIGTNTLIEPGYSWMPSLLVQGDATFASTNAGPSESTIGVNLNPAHTPSGMDWDDAIDDNYRGGVEGVSYVSGNAIFSLPRQNIRGTMVVGGDARIQTGVTVNIVYDAGVATLPPYGFFEDAGGLAIDPSSVVWSTPD